MGNFGVAEGFLMLIDIPSKEISQFVSIGMQNSDVASLKNGVSQLLLQGDLQSWIEKDATTNRDSFLPSNVGFSLPFAVEPDCPGLVGLGSKLVSEPYNENDKELLDTLVNNLVVALKNARSFEQIKLLNEDLQAKNIKLEKALRKVEILEDVKANLSKFVPNTVTRLIEKSPNGIIPESKEQDVSVLFLDIEGYTKMCEELEGSEVNAVIEHCFSVFMDAIFANNGDINETAGDGLMVLFLNEDKMTNALEAVRTALKIKEEAARIKSQFKSLSAPLIINMGINSGPALVGAAKFDSYTGSRWTYTARGSVTNVAARIGAQASDGKILLSKTTADRVKVHFSLNSLGRFHLKNVTEEIEIFQV
jgi:class 3 adenylate cyclase